MPSRRGSQLSEPSSDDETMQLLAKRIQALLAENEGIKEKVRFLENIVQEVTKEKDSYKAMMKQLTSSKSVVEGTTSTAQAVVDQASALCCIGLQAVAGFTLGFVVWLAARSENPIRVLQSLLLKSLTENERLKVAF
jgi:cell division septum initiation protein DivIVA